MAKTKHGLSRDPVYRVYTTARDRCTNPKSKYYPGYGGRGIEFRFESFEQFMEHVGPRPDGYWVERINNDGHYEPGNVRWATPAEQAQNRRPNTPRGPRGPRHQKGSLTVRSEKWYVRYYKDGRQVAEFLVDKDEKYHSKTCKPVRDKLAEKMREVNKDKPRSSLTAQQFWEKTYLPFVERHKRPSTAESYENIWGKWLKEKVGPSPLSSWRPSDGTRLLTEIAEKGIGHRTLAHIKNLASGMWSHAVALGECETNAWRDAKSLVKARPPKETRFYSLAEAKAVIDALDHRTDAQLAVALSFFCGLRAGEIRGLKWEDLDGASLHVRRAVVRNKVGDTKTQESQSAVPLIAPVLALWRAWNEKAGKPETGWVFEYRKKPADLREMGRKVIRPAASSAGVEWTGFQAGRRGCATLLTTLTGTPQAASQMLRHRTMSVTMSNYVKDDRRALAAGVKLLEAENEKKEEKES